MLIIVESPAKAKTISKIVGKKHVVKASVGHIRSLSNESKLKDGRKLEISGIDIENEFHPLYVVDEKKTKVVSELKKLAKAAKDGILFATDSDREGEAISWHLSEVLGVKDKSTIKRLEFHEITSKAIQAAMDSPRPLNIQLVHAQQARQVLDKLVGYTLSPVIWTVMGNRHLSAGRVQTPALHLICEREKEILAFIPDEYWNVTGIFTNTATTQAQEKVDLAAKDDDDFKDVENEFKLHRIKGDKVPKLSSQEQLQQVLVGLASRTRYVVASVDEKTETSRTKPPFTTSTLQQSSSSALGFSPKITMQIAQKLYEGIDVDGVPTALITYMRTDSVSLSKDAITAVRTIISKKYPDALPENSKGYKTKSRNAQEAHEAIRPTDPLRTPESLKGKIEPRMWKLYDLIWRRTVACQMTDELRTRLTFTLENNDKDAFTGSVAWTIKPGFKYLYPSQIKQKPEIKYEKGQEVYLEILRYKQHFTKPPSRYSAASLIKKLEELGIGRPSTYATIISTLIDREYVENKTNQMAPTALGMKVNDLLAENFNQVTSSSLTADMENDLDHIARGDKEYNQVLSEFWFPFKQDVQTKSKTIADDREKYRSTASDVACPTCNSEMVLKIGRFGEYFQCTNEKTHQFPKNFREYEKALIEARHQFSTQAKGKKCEECGKELIVRVSKSSLKPYIACEDYKVGNKHTVMSVSYGPCPKCKEEGRTGDEAGVIVQKKAFRGKPYFGCSLPKEKCGYIQKKEKEEEKK